MALGDIVADAVLWECDSCFTTYVASPKELRDAHWKLYEYPDGVRLVLCDKCVADYAKKRKAA